MQSAGDEMVFALKAVVNVPIVVIVRGAEPENQAIAALELAGQPPVLNQVLQPVGSAFDGEAAVLPDREGAEPAVAGADQAFRRLIHRHRRPAAQKKLSIGAKALFLFRRQRDVVSPGKAADHGAGQGRAQIPHRDFVHMAVENQFQQQPARLCPI